MIKGWANTILNHEESPNSFRKGSSLNAPKLGLKESHLEPLTSQSYIMIKDLAEIGKI